MSLWLGEGVRILKSLIPLSKWVVVIGAVLYGLAGVLNMDIISGLFGGGSLLAQLIFWSILLSGLWATYNKVTKPTKKKR
jgi:uncharacterized membrane protein YuzA (DUF378 family)